MQRNKKRMAIPVILLSCVLGLGIVYAATTGLLNFSGSVVVNPNAKVGVQDLKVTHGKAEDTVNISADSQTITFKVHLNEYGDYSIISAKLYNAGNVPIVLGSLTNVTTPPAGIKVTWPAGWDGMRLEAGATTDYYDIRVEQTYSELPPAIDYSPIAPPGEYTFSATLSYTQTT